MSKIVETFRQQIHEQAAKYLTEGCVLTIEDLKELKERVGYTAHSYIENLHPEYKDGSYFMGPVEVIFEKILGRDIVIRSAKLPIEETEYEEVVAEIVSKRRRKKVRILENKTCSTVGPEGIEPS